MIATNRNPTVSIVICRHLMSIIRGPIALDLCLPKFALRVSCFIFLRISVHPILISTKLLCVVYYSAFRSSLQVYPS